MRSGSLGAFIIGKRFTALKIQRLVFSLAASTLVVAASAFSPTIQAQESAQQAQPTGLVAQFQKIEDQWSTALTHQDQFTLETILAPSFVDISATGEIAIHNQEVAAMFEKGEPRTQSLQQRVVDVRVIEDVAIVDGTYNETTKLNGIERAEQGVFTHIYQRSRDAWKCVQSQRTAVPQTETGKNPKKKKLRF